MAAIQPDWHGVSEALKRPGGIEGKCVLSGGDCVNGIECVHGGERQRSIDQSMFDDLSLIHI